MRKKLFILIAAATLTLSMGACSSNSPADTTDTETSSETDSSDTDSSKGEFSSFTAEDIDGNEVTQEILKDYDLTVMNVWGTFCSPCIREMPDLGELSAEYAEKGVQIIGVVIDVRNSDGSFSESGIAEAKELIASTGANYLHLLPSDDLMDIHLETVSSIPYTIFLDKEGNILDTTIGSMNKENWKKTIDSILKEMN